MALAALYQRQPAGGDKATEGDKFIMVLCSHHSWGIFWGWPQMRWHGWQGFHLPELYANKDFRPDKMLQGSEKEGMCAAVLIRSLSGYFDILLGWLKHLEGSKGLLKTSYTYVILPQVFMSWQMYAFVINGSSNMPMKSKEWHFEVKLGSNTKIFATHVKTWGKNGGKILHRYIKMYI